MIRGLLIIFGVATLVGMASCTIAGALGAKGFMTNAQRYGDAYNRGGDFNPDYDWGEDGDLATTGEVVTRDFPWVAGEMLNVMLPADIVYTQGPVAKLTVTGPKATVDALILSGGRMCAVSCNYADGVSFDWRRGWRIGGAENWRRIKVVATAPNIEGFDIHGTSRLSINGLKQEALRLEAHSMSRVEGDIEVERLNLSIHSSGRVTLKGSARKADVEVHSSGVADLSDLANDEVKAEIHSSGRATLAPKQAADLEVHSSGRVVMLTRPERLNTDTHSSGSVDFRTRAENDRDRDRSEKPAAPAQPSTPGRPIPLPGAAPPAKPAPPATST